MNLIYHLRDESISNCFEVLRASNDPHFLCGARADANARRMMGGRRLWRQNTSSQSRIGRGVNGPGRRAVGGFLRMCGASDLGIKHRSAKLQRRDLIPTPRRGICSNIVARNNSK